MSEEFTIVELSVAERILGLGLLRQWKGNLEDLAAIQEDLKQFPFTEEEKAEIELVEKEGSIQWNQEKGDASPKKISLQKASVEFLNLKIKELSDSNSLSLSDGPILGLYEKLK